jgi:hypothetical protein
MAFLNRKHSNAFVQSNNQEITTMFQQSSVTPSPIVNQETNNTTQNTIRPEIQSIFDSRRAFVKGTGWDKILDLTKEQIEQMSAEAVFMNAFSKGLIRVTQVSNESRKEGAKVIFSNSVQDKELGAALAIYAECEFFADYRVKADGYREILLIDTKGNHDMVVIEERNLETGKIQYRARYATKAYNDHGDLIGLRPGEENPVQKGIDGALNGWTGEDGVVHSGYNTWVDDHNAAVLKHAQGGVLTEEDKSLLKNVTALDGNDPAWANKFVQANTVKHVAYDSVVNHYVLLAWFVLGEKVELFTFARTPEAFQTWLDGRNSNLTKGYQRQMRKLAGIVYEPVTR